MTTMPAERSQERTPALALAARVLRTEAAAVEGLIARLDDRFEAAVAVLAACRGRVIVTGMGKSGLICRKIAIRSRALIAEPFSASSSFGPMYSSSSSRFVGWMTTPRPQKSMSLLTMSCWFSR